MTIEYLAPPACALRVRQWKDLPDANARAEYLVHNSGQEPFKISVAKNKRRVLEGLIHQPLYAASFCRVSDQVLLLRELGVEIETETFRNDSETGRRCYGIYFLRSDVRPIVGRKG